MVCNSEYLLGVTTGKPGAEEGANNQMSSKHRGDSPGFIVKRLTEESPKNP